MCQDGKCKTSPGNMSQYLSAGRSHSYMIISSPQDGADGRNTKATKIIGEQENKQKTGDKDNRKSTFVSDTSQALDVLYESEL